MSVVPSQAELVFARGPKALAVVTGLAMLIGAAVGVGRLGAGHEVRPAAPPSRAVARARPSLFATASPRPGVRAAAAPSLVGPPARPFVLKGAERAEAVKCLTAAVYYEAAQEPREGQEAVAQVVLNRVRNPDYPKSVCGVVFQGAEQPGCQFTFACDGSMARTPAAWAWRSARDVAEKALSGHVQPAVGLATHYHADWMTAPWAPAMIRVAAIGQHLFYRRPGQAGAPSAFDARYRGGEARASRTWLIGRPQPPLQTSGLVQASTGGQVFAPRDVVRGGRTIALAPSTLFLTRGAAATPVRIPAQAMAAGRPTMHAMILMRAAAARAARAAERDPAQLAATGQADQGLQPSTATPTDG